MYRLRTFAVLFFSLALLGPALKAQPQPFGNEWIDYTQEYFRITVAHNGLYRLTYNQLDNAGVPLNAIQSSQLRIYNRGKQVPIFISDGGDGQLNPGDYIEFLGFRNDGRLDNRLYRKPHLQPHQYQSMFSDTSAYFLTWTSTGAQLSYKPVNYSSAAPVAQGRLKKETFQIFSDYFSEGIPVWPAANHKSADYNEGTGLTSGFVTKGASRIYTLSTPAVNAGAAPVLEYCIFGSSDAANTGQSPNQRIRVEVGATSTSYRTVLDTTFKGYAPAKRNLALNWSDMANGQLLVRVTSVGIPAAVVSTIVVSYVKVNYSASPASFTQADFGTWYFPDGQMLAGNYSLAFSKAASGDQFDLFDLTNHKRYIGSSTDSLRFLLEDFRHSDSLILVNASRYRSDASIRQVFFRKPDFSRQPNFLIITHTSLLPSAADLKDFKENEDTTQDFRVLMETTEQLYDQFYYGVHHPSAVQNYISYCWHQGLKQVKYVLLIGRAMSPTAIRLPHIQALDLVPSLGVPTSEIQLVAGMDRHFNKDTDLVAPPVSLGRLAATNNDQVRNYIVKMREYYQVPQEKWQKRVILATTGWDAKEQENNKKILSERGSALAGNYTGCEIRGLYSTLTSHEQTSLNKVLKSEFNSGTALYTYMGHGSNNNMSLEVGFAKDVQNKGRYPIMYLNGCNVGDVAADGTRGTDFLMSTSNSGGMVWMGHSGTTIVQFLATQQQHFFDILRQDTFHGTAGDLYMEVIRQMQARGQMGSDFGRNVVLQWSFQGDPSIPFYFKRTTDYSVDRNSYVVDPADVISTMENFRLGIVVTNHGRVNADSFEISLHRRLPQGGEMHIGTQKVPAIGFMDTIWFTIPLARSHQGYNFFQVYVDSPNHIPELDDIKNNFAEIELYIPGTGARLLTPYSYSIVNTLTPELVAQSRNVYDQNPAAYFEIDTTHHFNSPWRKSSGRVTGLNTIAWTPQLLPQDSMVYYWRSRLDKTVEEGGEWYTGSFTYIKNGYHGWSQSHVGQLQGLTPSREILFDTTGRTIAFFGFEKEFLIQTNPWRHSQLGLSDMETGSGTAGTCGSSTLLARVIDRFTLSTESSTTNPNERRWFRWVCSGVDGTYHDPNSTAIERNYYQFNTRLLVDQARIRDFIDTMHVGDYLMMGTRGASGINRFANWEEQTLAYFDAMGVHVVRQANNDSFAYGFFVQKLDNGWHVLTQDILFDNTNAGQSDTDILQVRAFPTGINYTQGSIASSLVGPAKEWHSAHFHFYEDDSPSDKQFVRIIGVDRYREETVLADSLERSYINLVDIDASVYPYLKLQVLYSDARERSPTMLKDWTVYYQGAPEGTIVLDSTFAFASDTLSQGEMAHIRVKFQNVSPYPFDSVLVGFIASDTFQRIIWQTQKRFGSIQPFHSLMVDHEIPTAGLEGVNQLRVVVNPYFDQPEVALDNNVFTRRFYVTGDLARPWLDVKLNGRYLPDNAVVGSSPTISVTLTDVNAVLPLDTPHLNAWLQYPNEDTLRPIPFNHAWSQYGYEKDTVGGKLWLDYRPHDLEEGTYMLKVNGSDASGNHAATTDYSIRFRVVRETAASRIHAYPNPAQDIVFFRYEAQGDEVPDNLMVSVYDLAGKVVAASERVRNPGAVPGSNVAAVYVGHLPAGLYYFAAEFDPKVPQLSSPEDKITGHRSYGKIVIAR